MSPGWPGNALGSPGGAGGGVWREGSLGVSAESAAPMTQIKEDDEKLREALNAQKNAQRAAMRAQFRRKYRLSESPEDTNHLRSVGGKVSLPPELSKIIHPETKTKDDSFNLLSAFQGLSISRAVLTRGKPSRTPTPASAHGDSCRVM
ncbi:hypothetical protein AMECASPLE_007473 [Ameca splendens]|uniref:Complexin-1/2 n=1 Tax=Ameca splendens TaxID=208324 RepID=A0ABV0YAP5_9TELE